jgi:hypothetical protein
MTLQEETRQLIDEFLEVAGLKVQNSMGDLFAYEADLRCSLRYNGATSQFTWKSARRKFIFFCRQTSRRFGIIPYMNTVLTTRELQPRSERDEARLRDAGFRWGQKGTHTSRTIMLNELREVFANCRPNATRDDYLSAIHEDNCLGKRTAATRKLSSQRLSELYAISPEVPLFRVMRRFWYVDREGQGLLALLLSLARDPLLRASAPPVLRMRPGEELARQQMTDALTRAVGSRLSESTLDKVVRNAASSWTQSGHLKGRGRKVRQTVTPTAITTTYALLLGYFTGKRGIALFESLWAQVLDAPVSELINLAMDARRLGFLDMSQSGGVIDVSFSRLLAQNER